jgi:hypothetical protein
MFMRVARAQQLARRERAAREPLEFYITLATLQESLLRAHSEALHREAAFAEALEAGAVAGALPQLLQTLICAAPAPLARAAWDLIGADSCVHRTLLERYWEIPGEQSRDERVGDDVAAFIAEVVLQPFAEAYAQRVGTGVGENGTERGCSSGTGGDDAGNGRMRRCVVCGDRPVVAVLRERGHGARRSVVCGFCLAEWAVPRVECVWCGEARFEKLSNYRAEEFPAARIDTCETCRRYIKTIDLVRDGTAVPVVDDLATVALDIWAREHGYRRSRPNLLRL